MVFRSKWQAFKLATLSGFAEPLGVIIVGRPTSFLCVCETFVLLENKIGKTNLLCFMFEGAGWILTISGAEKAWFLVDSSGFNQNRVAPRTLNFWLIFFFFFSSLFSPTAYLFPSSLSPEILEGLLGSGLCYILILQNFSHRQRRFWLPNILDSYKHFCNKCSWWSDGFFNPARDAALGVWLCRAEASYQGRVLGNGFHVREVTYHESECKKKMIVFSRDRKWWLCFCLIC